MKCVIEWPKPRRWRGPHMHHAVFVRFGYVTACGEGHYLTAHTDYVSCPACKRKMQGVTR